FIRAHRSADLAVNATTVGMIDAGTTMQVELLPTGATVFDLVYVPPETPLLRAARRRGLRAANGSEMLIQQAAIAFERWTAVGGMADGLWQGADGGHRARLGRDLGSSADRERRCRIGARCGHWRACLGGGTRGLH